MKLRMRLHSCDEECSSSVKRLTNMQTETITAPLDRDAQIPTCENVSHLGLHWYSECAKPEHLSYDDYDARRRAELAPFAAAYYTGVDDVSRARAVIEAARGSNHCTVMEAWASAMTFVYGPVGLHASWCGPDGRPSAEAIAKIPDLADRMADALDRLRRLLRVC